MPAADFAGQYDQRFEEERQQRVWLNEEGFGVYARSHTKSIPGFCRALPCVTIAQLDYGLRDECTPEHLAALGRLVDHLKTKRCVIHFESAPPELWVSLLRWGFELDMKESSRVGDHKCFMFIPALDYHHRSRGYGYEYFQ